MPRKPYVFPENQLIWVLSGIIFNFLLDYSVFAEEPANEQPQLNGHLGDDDLPPQVAAS